MKEIRPFGSWRSPLGSADLVRGALRLSATHLEDHALYWLEGRPSEGGRQVVMLAELDGTGDVSRLSEASPPGSHVRTRVHEYGGGEYAVGQGRIFYVDDADRRLHGASIGGSGRPLAPAGSAFADLTLSPDGRWLLLVEERPREGREPENRLVALPLPKSGLPVEGATPRVIASGHDFYASPTFSPRGDRLAWLAWDHPNMPWNGTWLETLQWRSEGPGSSMRAVAGGPSESIFQPRFAADGRLFAMSDRSGWWNLVCVTDSGCEPVHHHPAELGRPQWVFGLSSWAFLGEDEIVASATVSGVDQLVRVSLSTGRMSPIETPFRTVGAVEAAGGRIACIAGAADRPTGVYLGSVDPGTPRCIRESASLDLPETGIRRAEARVFVSEADRETNAFLYPPRSATVEGPAGERPPLLVKTHGGPTAAASSAFDPRIQFWTSRGFFVADVNYGGSAGFGRAYRDRLHEAWGVLDVEDCLAVARSLADESRVDPTRLAISGGSAGGYTTLCALTFHDVFAAGASHYGIGDLEALARDTHKFESRYTDWPVGPLPGARARYRERSPIRHPDRLARPVIFFQGLEDRVVPPNQTEAMVAVLAARDIPHAYVAFEGEGHGFRRAENIRTALDGELYFYSRVFGFEAPRPERVRVIGMRERE
ncbi:MAG: dipeptidyl-peptidase 5 [bacterium]